MKKSLFYLLIVFVFGCQAPKTISQTKINTPTFLKNQNPLDANKKWILVEELSDEFEGTTIDLKKWQIDPIGNGWSWIGRAPGLFRKENVSVKDGMLQVTVGTLEPQTINGKDYKYQGAIVRSINPGLHGWYYEAKMKANATAMSSTFWLMSNNRNCKTKHELDIQECVGRTSELTKGWAKNWDHVFHSNTIHRKTSCNPEPTQIQGSVETTDKNHERFFVYGAWWKSPTEVLFFLDGKYVYTINPSTPFNVPAWIQMAIETYDWNPVPSNGGLVKAGTKSQRTTKYEWVRVWKVI